MRTSKLFEKALEIPRVQEILADLDEEDQHLCLRMCYHCVAREVIECFREEENREVSPLEGLLVALEFYHTGDVEFVEDEEGIVRANLTVHH